MARYHIMSLQATTRLQYSNDYHLYEYRLINLFKMKMKYDRWPGINFNASILSVQITGNRKQCAKHKYQVSKM